MRVDRALVVEDDVPLAVQLVGVLEAGLATEARACRDLVSAEAVLEGWRPDLLILDVCLPDGQAGELLDLLHRVPPFPATVAMSARATPTEAFDLGALGARAYLAKPFGLDEFEAAVRQALSEAPDPLPQVRGAVGEVPLRDLEADVRRTMVDEALRRAGGSRRGAARLLGVSRQFIQHVLKRFDDL